MSSFAGQLSDSAQGPGTAVPGQGDETTDLGCSSVAVKDLRKSSCISRAEPNPFKNLVLEMENCSY